MDADNVVAPAPAAAQEQLPAPPPEYLLFFRQNYKLLMAYIMHAGADERVADDLTSQTLTQMLSSWDDINEPIGWAKWRIRGNLLNYRDSERRRRAREERYGAATFERPAELGVWEDSSAVKELLGILTDHQRKVVAELLNGLTQAEIAKLLGTSYDAVRTILTEIRRRLEPHRPPRTRQPQTSYTSSAVRKEAR